MVTVNYKQTKDNFKLTIAGHAQCGEKGNDLVCCAVSTIAYTLAQALIDIQNRLKEPPTIYLEEGLAFIECEANGWKSDLETAKCIFHVGLSGFKLLQSNYPEAVTVID